MTQDDIPRVARLYAEMINELQEDTHDPYLQIEAFSILEIELSLEEDLADPEARIFVSEAEGAVVAIIVGHIVGTFLPFSNVRRVGQITAAYVQPNYRGRGLMQKLEQHLVNFFRELGLPYADLFVHSENTLGRNTWRALGYTTFREQMRRRI